MSSDLPPAPRAQRTDSPRLPSLHEAQAQDAANAEAWTAAFARLQQQVHYNSTAIEDQRRHLAELHEALRGLHGEVGNMWPHLDACAAQLRGRDERAARAGPADVDLLTSQIQSVAAKAAEVDGLKLQLDILTRRLRRLEGQSDGPGPAQAPRSNDEASHPLMDQHPHYAAHDQARAYPPPKTDSRRSTLSYHTPTEGRNSQERIDPRALPSIRTLEAGPEGSVSRAPQQPPPHQTFVTAYPDHEPRDHRAWSPSKRPAPIDPNTTADTAGSASPKRQRLATLMPRTNSGDAGPPPAGPLPHQPAALLPNGLRFVPLHQSEEATVTASWRPDHSGRPRAYSQKSSSQEAVEYKSEHARHNWPAAGPVDSQYRRGIEASQYHVQSAREPVPLHHAEYPSHEHHYAAMQSHHTSPNPDAYPDLSKKSRTKPIRNADGVLIRKDGRPDMRSVSSAQNLRKVHAKKEAERNSSATSPATSGAATTGGHAAAGSEADEAAATSSVISREDSVDDGGAAYEVRAGRNADTPMREVEEENEARHLRKEKPGLVVPEQRAAVVA